MSKNLLTTVCKCGEKLTGSNIIPPLKNVPNKDFYGGRVKRLADAVCKCGIEYIAYLHPINNGYSIIDMEYKNELIPVVEENKNNDNKPSQLDKFVCEKCGKEFENARKLQGHKISCKGGVNNGGEKI